MLTSFLNKHLRYVRVVKANHVTLPAGVSFFKTLKNYSWISFCKRLKKKLGDKKVLLNSFQMNGRTKGFHTQKRLLECIISIRLQDELFSTHVALQANEGFYQF